MSKKNRIFAAKSVKSMKHIEVITEIQVLQYEELTPAQRELVEVAKEQTKASYCPHSHFAVGAAARLGNGLIVRGANQENAAYPSGLCAERTALFAAGAQYPDEPVLELAIACFYQGKFLSKPGSPCGACRQVMVETEHRYGRPMEVILYGEEECYVLKKASDLMPLVFTELY